MSENIPYIIAEDGYYYVAYKEKVKVPELTVSAKGVANGLSEEYNDGWDFGPDSYSPTSTSAIPYTQTAGIKEAVNYAGTQYSQSQIGSPNFYATIHLLYGFFYLQKHVTVSDSVIPNGIKIVGEGWANTGIVGPPNDNIFVMETQNAGFIEKMSLYSYSELTDATESQATLSALVYSGPSSTAQTELNMRYVQTNGIFSNGLFNISDISIFRAIDCIFDAQPLTTQQTGVYNAGGTISGISGGVTLAIFEAVEQACMMTLQGFNNVYMNGMFIQNSSNAKSGGNNGGFFLDTCGQVRGSGIYIQNKIQSGTGFLVVINGTTNSISLTGIYESAFTTGMGLVETTDVSPATSAGSLDMLSIHDAVFPGSGNMQLFYANGGSNVGSLTYDNVQGNLVASDVSAVSTPSVPASGTAQQNTNPYAVKVYVTGGALTEIQITINGTAYTVYSNSTASAVYEGFTLPAGASITLTYSTAPTWSWVPE